MSNLHLSPHTIQVTKTFAEGGLVTVVTVLSAIIAVTLIYAWFFT